MMKRAGNLCNASSLLSRPSANTRRCDSGPLSFHQLIRDETAPAVVLWADPAQIDFTLAFVSSQNLANAGSNDVIILPSHAEFALTGLSVASKIRAEKLVTLSRSLVTRRLGKLGPLLIVDLDRALIAALGINIIVERRLKS